MKEWISSRRIEPILPLNRRLFHSNSKQKEWFKNPIKQSKISNIKDSNIEHKINIMVSKLGETDSKNHIHDIYTVNYDKMSSPKLLFHKCKQVDIDSLLEKQIKISRNTKELQSHDDNSQQRVKRSSKPSSNHLLLPNISSRGRVKIRQRSWSVQS